MSSSVTQSQANPAYVVHMADVIKVGNLKSFNRTPNIVVAHVPVEGFATWEDRVAMAQKIADALTSRDELIAAMADGTI